MSPPVAAIKQKGVWFIAGSRCSIDELVWVYGCVLLELLSGTLHAVGI